nr:MAG TPA: hypothetical protein [Caudoviricetes sp.]
MLLRKLVHNKNSTIVLYSYKHCRYYLRPFLQDVLLRT